MLSLYPHYESYGASVKATLPEGYEAFAKTSPSPVRPDHFGTAYNLLASLARKIQEAIAADDLANYRSSLETHQLALKSMCEAMAKEELAELGPPSAESLLSFIGKKGPVWFRYAPVVMTLTLAGEGEKERTVTLLPHYCEEHLESVPEGGDYLDAVEMALVAERGRAFSDQLFAAKQRVGGRKGLKFAPPGHHTPSHLVLWTWQDYNRNHTVHDWLLPLFEGRL